MSPFKQSSLVHICGEPKPTRTRVQIYPC